MACPLDEVGFINRIELTRKYNDFRPKKYKGTRQRRTGGSRSIPQNTVLSPGALIEVGVVDRRAPCLL